MEITMKTLLSKDTWVSKKAKVIITADITWQDGVGSIHHGFLIEDNMSQKEFNEALTWKNAGDYLLEKYPADGTFLPKALRRMSFDEALALVQSSDDFVGSTYEDHHFNYEVVLWRGYGYWLNAPLAFEAKDEEEALVFASLADPSARLIDEEDTEGVAEAEAHPDQWVFLDRSAYGAQNVWIFDDRAIIKKAD